MGAVSDYVLEQLAPATAEDPDGILETWVTQLCDPFEELLEVADSESHEGLGLLLDVDNCPTWALAWLAQFAGATIPPGLTYAEQREAIRSQTGAARGTPLSIVTAIQPHLTGNKTVFMRERYEGDAYALLVATRTDETPDPAAAEAVARAAKPMGLILTFVTVDGMTIEELGTTYSTIADVEADYTTIGEIGL